MSYIIESEIELNEDALIEARKNLGKFVLASNKVDLDPEVMLNYYEGTASGGTWIQILEGQKLPRFRSLSQKRGAD